MMLSVMPSVRYSSCGSAPAFTNGSTASDFPRGRARLPAAARDRPGQQRAQRHGQILRATRNGAPDRARRSAPTMAPQLLRRQRIEGADRSGGLSCSSFAMTSCGVAPVNSRRPLSIS